MSGILLSLLGAVPTIPTDPYFNYNTLLLPGNGTNGAQNNTFLDSSANTFSITRNGDTTQGTFSPFSLASGYWSNYFDGSGDFFTLGTTFLNQITSSTATFTMEAWVFLSSYSSGSQPYYDRCILAKGKIYFSFGVDSNGKLFLYHYDGSPRTNASTNAVPLNQWVHVAAVVNGSGVISFYINGVANGTATWYGNSGSNQEARLGSTDDIGAGGNSDWLGYISNLRVTTTQVYTSAFTPPTAPLTAITGTIFLSCNSNRFVDQSVSGYTLTPAGTPSVQAFSPFLPTAAYSALTNGGSGYFDGSGDYLVTPSNAALQYGTGDYTYECWIYHTSISGQQTYFARSTAGNYNGVYFYKDTSNYVGVYYTTQIATSNVTITANQWYYLVATRLSGTLRIFINGVQVASVADTTNLTESVVTVGADANGSSAFSGFMCGARILKGVGYSSITVPTTPPTAITNTSLLLNFTNAGIIDNTAKNDLVTVGGAQISTAQSKFGGASMYFDGTGDWLTAPSGPITSLEGDFTVEGWVYLSSTAAAWPVFTVGDSSGASGIELYRATSNGKWRVYQSNTARIDSSTSTSTGSWVHLAVVRSSGSVKLYVDGVNEGSAWSTTQSFSGAVYVGAEFNSGSVTVSANGYIDDLRITKGIARYTANFTPPTAAFPLQ
ncbi:MAG: LamG domain-containing protein [Actinobacteria bacterium]|nr:LamG domain-containing protein [Actinomycetota bacterium]